jgi:ankyrin repeat protein
MDSTALHWACFTGSTNVASLLLAKGANPNAQDASGMTPLHHAVDSAAEKVGDCSLVRWLLIYGANPLLAD